MAAAAVWAFGDSFGYSAKHSAIFLLSVLENWMFL